MTASRLHVGIDARVVPGTVGGVEQYVVGLVHAVTHLEDGDERYTIQVHPDAPDWISPHVGPRGELVVGSANVNDRRVATTVRSALARHVPGARDLWRRVGFARGPVAVPASDGTLERAGVDLIHFPKQDAYTTSVPSIYQPWDLQHEHLPMLFSPHARRWRDVTYRTFVAEATLVITASRWVRDDLARRYGLERERTAIVNAPPPLDLYAAPEDPAVGHVRARYRLGDRYLVYPAHMWPHKNHVRLMESLGRTAARDVIVVCTGAKTGHYREVARAAQRTGVEQRVRFLGLIPADDLRAVFELADGMIFPSLFEGWGFPIVEAFRLGVPVACSNVTSLPELVGDAALVFDPSDAREIASAIDALWSDAALRRRLAEAGRRRVANLDWPSAARRVRGLYRRAAGRELTPEDIAALRAPTLA